MRTNQQSSSPVDLLDLQDELNQALCRLKALTHGVRCVYEAGVFQDEADGFDLLFTDVVERFNGIHADLTAYADRHNNVIALSKVANFN